MELQGGAPNVIHATVHTVATVATGQNTSRPYTLASGDFASDYHVFSLLRGRGRMEFYVEFCVDGQRFSTRAAGDFPRPYPFNGPFYFILNVAAGDDYDGYPGTDTRFPQAMQVEYVRFWRYIP